MAVSLAAGLLVLGLGLYLDGRVLLSLWRALRWRRMQGVLVTQPIGARL